MMTVGKEVTGNEFPVCTTIKQNSWLCGFLIALLTGLQEFSMLQKQILPATTIRCKELQFMVLFSPMSVVAFAEKVYVLTRVHSLVGSFVCKTNQKVLKQY